VLRATIKGIEALLDEYCLYILTRKSDLPQDYSTRDMSDDYAEMIQQTFNGHVDLVIGMSFGGLIAQHFAADYTEMCSDMVITMAAHKISDEGRELERRYAQLLSQGKDRAAYAMIATLAIPKGIAKSIFKLVFWLLAGFIRGPKSETFKQDVKIEVEAELSHDASQSLPLIDGPILVICGENDRYFPVEIVEEFGELLPKAKILLYEGRGHDVIADTRFAEDIRSWINSNDPAKT
jgi:pimeloyl-ACP methyl ester carboxylesterase